MQMRHHEFIFLHTYAITEISLFKLVQLWNFTITLDIYHCKKYFCAKTDKIFKTVRIKILDAIN